MKRVFALLLTLLMLIPLLTACGACSHEYDNATDLSCNDCEANRLVATWITTIEGDTGEMTLKENGTGSITSNGYTRPCLWRVEEGTLTVDQDLDGFVKTFLNQVTFSFDEDCLTVTSQSGNTLTFTKKEA